jgi:hypothetical protein
MSRAADDFAILLTFSPYLHSGRALSLVHYSNGGRNR